MGIAAYKRTISETESPRQIERRVLSRVTSDLEQFASRYDSAERGIDQIGVLADGLRDALWNNQQVWKALQHDLAAEGNTLPPTLRAGLISLSIWVDTHTTGILKGQNKVGPLIAINQTIIRALGGNALQVME
ncbi:MAG: flagellar biosynthesis regulator FlaF [Antarcticimicrobium sp.]|uniref:flagellar biosynthesis regulator FlaF n=1 Tax=Antarcticimicrobium sp. TaxID=2824147 RepID=UPI0026351E87|nr:flagellar biosynthesis regulator FlaF [Antarcticimicrobium sp.]MDF1716229.1 flagellar biosynthesis regulator FlaF [Antarcticimicrobium sp.]